MRIGSLGYSPYIYNTNYVNAQSMNKIAPIDDDLVTSGTDYSSLTDDFLNENPLQRGETSHFADVLAMQFHMSQMNASRLIKPAEEVVQSAEQDSRRDQYMEVQDITADVADDVLQQTKPASEAVNMQMDRNIFAMQRAAEAYRVNMIA